MRVDGLWFLAEEASQQAERAYHRLHDRYADFIEPTHSRRVSRSYFRTLADRVRETGAPFGAHTIVHRDGELLLVRHEGVDLWVVPGGEVDDGESFREAAERELAEEAGVDARYDGLAMVSRVDIDCGSCATWGVVPIFAARALSTEAVVDDPDGEISAARWFPVDELPADTRDRRDLLAWAERALA